MLQRFDVLFISLDHSFSETLKRKVPNDLGMMFETNSAC